MTEEKSITAIILAGGKSTRMKTEKGLVSFRGKMIVEQAYIPGLFIPLHKKTWWLGVICL